MKKQKMPPGWTLKQVRELAAYYDNMTDEAQVAMDEAPRRKGGTTLVSVPDSLLPDVRKLLASALKKRSFRKGTTTR